LTDLTHDFVGPIEPAQRALEREIHREGRVRVLQRIKESEQSGLADTTPYARPLYRRYLIPLIEAIKEAIATTDKPGRRKAHVALLKPLDPASVAFVGMNTVLCTIMASKDDMDARKLSRAVGTALHRELVLSVFENTDDDLYWTIMRDLDRRRSKDARYKYRVIRDTASKHDMELPEWSPGEREQAGAYIVECLRVLGFLTISRRRVAKMGRGLKVYLVAALTDDALEVVANISELAALTTPLHLPFVEQPRDWTAFNRGGYHTPWMRRLNPYCIASPRTAKRETLEAYRTADLRQVRAAINKLQSVRWQINGEMLDVMRLIATKLETQEVMQHADVEPPARPAWLTGSVKPEEMTEAQREAFMAWKQQMRAWHNDKKSRKTKFQRFYYATRIAERFREYEAIYFLYRADFRGRLYAVTTGVNPQGSDMQKALLRFADGKPLADKAAQDWFMIAGANRFGVDKTAFAERIQWVRDNHLHILDMADDPVSHDGWMQADKPLQFLAWCKEYAAWKRNPDGFLSHLPVGMDGSCNGLQHFSAMLRDVVGGRATNLVPSDKPSDIYQQVAEVVQTKLSGLKMDQLSERDQALAQKWIAHGINRKLVKRSVMTLPYGSTRFSCAQFIVDDYLHKGEAPEFAFSEYTQAANFLSHLVWAAIGEVVVAATQAMQWLRACAGKLIAQGASQIQWTAPSGFPVVQAYFDADYMHVNSMLLGGVRIKVAQSSERPHKNRHKNGISPNFVHSMDAAHLTLTVLEADKLGIDSLAMIHDDYGTHAADAAKLARAIRECFVRMYEQHAPLSDFRARYHGLPTNPLPGSLEIREVLRSPFFFA